MRVYAEGRQQTGRHLESTREPAMMLTSCSGSSDFATGSTLTGLRRVRSNRRHRVHIALSVCSAPEKSFLINLVKVVDCRTGTRASPCILRSFPRRRLRTFHGQARRRRQQYRVREFPGSHLQISEQVSEGFPPLRETAHLPPLSLMSCSSTASWTRLSIMPSAVSDGLLSTWSQVMIS